jgi:hypothetical protein
MSKEVFPVHLPDKDFDANFNDENIIGAIAGFGNKLFIFIIIIKIFF